jgi:protein O-mannosyl-transferase
MNRRKDRPSSSIPKPPLPAIPEIRREKRRELWLGVLLFASTVLVYAQVWNFEFVTVDDSLYVAQIPYAQDGLTLRNLRWCLTSIHDSNWIPLTRLSLMLDSLLYGLRPGGYHLTNALLHAANTVLLFAVLVVATGARGRSAFVAALFALHPLHVESVAWVAERKDVLSIFFGLLSILAYVRYARGAGAARWSFAAAIFCFVLSLLSKQTLVTLPFLLLLLDYWPLGRLRPRAQASPSSRAKDGSQQGLNLQSVIAGLLLEKIPFFAASAGFSAAAAIAQAQSGAMLSLSRFPLSVRCGNAVLTYVAYLWKTVYPQNLAVYYPHPGNALDWTAVGLAAALLLAVSVAAVMAIRRYPFVFVGWCWYLGTLFPLIGIVQIGSQQMADRYTYFPLIGIFLAFAWLVPEFVPEGPLRNRVLPAAAIACVALFAVTTFSQISYWHDSVTLLRHSMDSTADNPVAHEFLGAALFADGAFSESVTESEAAIRLSPQFAPLYVQLAVALERLGRLDEAADQYRAALALDGRLLQARNQLGALLFKSGKYAEAKEQFRKELELDDQFALAHVNLALVALQTGDFAEAIAHGEKALELDPGLVVCHHYVALALRGQRRYDEAIGRLRRLLEITPDDELARQELAETQAMKAAALSR